MIVGIDLGTTNSLISIWRDGKVELIPNSLGEKLTPSVVGLDEQGQVLVGMAAKDRMITHPELTAANFKRYMGTDRETLLGKKRLRAEELSALVLKSLKADAEAYLGETIMEAVITVPAYFNDSQRKATRIAGELAGFKVERLLNEPTAAALAYGLQDRKESRFLVFDLGGGTFDVSIVEYFEDILEVHASAGNNFLGGEDFTTQIYKEFFLPQLDQLGEKNTSVPPKLEQLLRFRSEQAKIQLGSTGTVTMKVQWKDKLLEIAITNEQFEKSVEGLLEKISDPIKRALRDSKLRASDLDEIVLVGGATRMSVVRSMVTRLFKRFPATDIDPDKVVVVGAAIQAGLKSRDEALKDIVMTDVCPYTLGTDTCRGEGAGLTDGYFLPIIERNSFIPVSREETLYAAVDYQTKIDFNIYQGESVRVKDNVFLGKLRVKIPKNKKGEEPVICRFTYDINGLLEVEVTVESNGEKFSMVIEENPGVLSPKEVAIRMKALEHLKIHPRAQLPNQALVNRAERIYQEFVGERREYISQWLSGFNAILEKQDEREIREARKDFSARLDELEDDTVFQ